MSKDHFVIPGSELLNPMVGKGAAPHQDVFAKSKNGGSLGRTRKPEPASADDPEEFIPEPVQSPPRKELLVRLSNPMFLVEDGEFEESVPFSIDAELPKELKDITRVIVTLWAVSEAGKKSQVHTKDFHIDGGKVTGELELRRPSQREGQPIESCPYAFTAKHRDSKEVESPRIQVKDKRIGNEELVLEFPGSKEIEAGGYTFELRSKDGSFKARMSPKSDEKKNGNLVLKFTKLKPELSYSLDVLDAQETVIETVFKDMPFGKWEGKGA